MKILLVCLGNICRSPLAEGILRHKVRARGLDWEIDSAGTGAWHAGACPDPRSAEVARRYGIDIMDQQARQIRETDLAYFDLVLVMDRTNYQDVLRLADSDAERDKVKMIMNYVFPGADRSVPDPYWDDDGFDRVYTMLEEACERLVARYAADVG